jgi:5-methylcytosine-specific restriction endonuclease McrA
MSAEAQRRYRERHPDRAEETRRRYLAAHPDRVREANRRRRVERSPEERHLRHFIDCSNTRARRYGVVGHLRPADVRLIVGPCSYCGGIATEWDHVNPLRNGGPNAISNLVPSCAPCNRRRPNPWKRGEA